MLNRPDASPSPSVAPVWPPPPSSAPETFTVEGISVTKHGEQLSLVNHKTGKSFLFSPLPMIVMYVFLWLNSLRSWSSNHHLSGPLNVLWNNPAFRSEVSIHALIFGLPALVMALFIWRQNSRGGRTVIHRRTKTLEVGKRSGVIRSVAINSIRPFFIRSYFVFPLLQMESKKTVPGMNTMFTFRRKENAVRVAQAIADFLDVPLHDFSAGALVQGIP